MEAIGDVGHHADGISKDGHLVALHRDSMITAAEVMVSITCLEFSYTQAPTKMKSFVMAAYLLGVSVGNRIGKHKAARLARRPLLCFRFGNTKE